MGITYRQLADTINGAEQSIRARVSKTGSYFGIRPFKLPNGRVLFPDDTLERLIAIGENGRTAASLRGRSNSGLKQVAKVQGGASDDRPT